MMANFDLLPHIIFFVLSGLLITGLIPIEWIVPRNRNRVRMPREEISPLPKTASECQSDLREKDRIIQCQRETIERLETMHARLLDEKIAQTISRGGDATALQKQRTNLSIKNF